MKVFYYTLLSLSHFVSFISCFNSFVHKYFQVLYLLLDDPFNIILHIKLFFYCIVSYLSLFCVMCEYLSQFYFRFYLHGIVFLYLYFSLCVLTSSVSYVGSTWKELGFSFTHLLCVLWLENLVHLH